MSPLAVIVCGAVGGILFRFGVAWWRNRRDAIEWHEWCDRYPDSPVALVERVWPTKRPRPLGSGGDLPRRPQSHARGAV